MPTDLVLKSFGLATEAVGERQIRVTVSTDQVDRSGDIVVQKGIRLDNFKASRTVLWNHDQDHPVAACVEIGLDSKGQLEALTQFPDAGISTKADEVYGLLKAGVINAASIGFLPLAAEPVDSKQPRKGIRIDESELLEFSFVSVPANPGAQVVQRALRGASVTAPGKLTRKGLYAVSELAYVLNMLGYQVDAAIAERAREGDDSDVPEQLRSALNALGQALIAMTTEEVTELLAGKEDDAGLCDDDDGIIFLSMLRGVFKNGAALPSLVGKSGRKFSAETAMSMRTHLKSIGEGHQALSDMLDDADAPDDTDDGSDGDDDDAKRAQAQRKRQTEVAALR